MRFDDLAEIHERLGDEYLDKMRAARIKYPPPVAWCTNPPFPSGRTSAVVFLDDEEIEVSGYPRDMLVSVVVMRALSGCLTNNQS